MDRYRRRLPITEHAEVRTPAPPWTMTSIAAVLLMAIGITKSRPGPQAPLQERTKASLEQIAGTILSRDRCPATLRLNAHSRCYPSASQNPVRSGFSRFGDEPTGLTKGA